MTILQSISKYGYEEPARINPDKGSGDGALGGWQGAQVQGKGERRGLDLVLGKRIGAAGARAQATLFIIQVQGDEVPFGQFMGVPGPV